MTDRRYDSDALLVHLDYIKKGIDGLAERLDTQNGQLRTHRDRLIVLETRADDGKQAGAKWGATLGAFVAALISGIAALFGMSK